MSDIEPSQVASSHSQQPSQVTSSGQQQPTQIVTQVTPGQRKKITSEVKSAHS